MNFQIPKSYSKSDIEELRRELVHYEEDEDYWRRAAVMAGSRERMAMSEFEKHQAHAEAQRCWGMANSCAELAEHTRRQLRVAEAEMA